MCGAGQGEWGEGVGVVRWVGLREGIYFDYCLKDPMGYHIES